MSHRAAFAILTELSAGLLLCAALAHTGPRPSVRDLTLPIAGLSPGDIRDTFNEGRDGHRHEATDIMAPRGTAVLAVCDGVIQKLFLSKAGGNTVYEFDDAAVYCYYYAHLDRYAAGVAEGQKVGKGHVIGYVGSSGNADAGAPHLHFAIFELGPEKQWWKGTPIDPYPVLQQLALKTGAKG